MFRARALGVLPAALVDEHLLTQFIRLSLIFQEINLQVVPQELGHGLLNELVGDGLFGLIFIGSLRGKGGRHEYQTILHILKGDFAFVF